MTDDSASHDSFSTFFQKDTFAAEALFPTPFLSATILDHDTVNAALSVRILEREKSERGVSVSNFGGWHSS